MNVVTERDLNVLLSATDRDATRTSKSCALTNLLMIRDKHASRSDSACDKHGQLVGQQCLFCVFCCLFIGFSFLLLLYIMNL